MSPFFRIKARLMKALMERQRSEPYNCVENDLFELPHDAGSMVNNSHFFGGYSMDGRFLTMRVAHRNGKMAEVFVIFVDTDGRFLTSEKQEYPDDECPLTVRNLIPARDWNVAFDGTLTDMNDGSRHHCTFNLNFRARLPIFNPPLHANLWGMAQAFAGQKWNRRFFNELRGDTGVGDNSNRYRQVHYEQTGRLEGSMTVDEQLIDINLQGIRDRAHGKRDWNYMDCHVWLIAATGNGEVMNLSIVSYPHAKNLFCGYMDYEEDRNYALNDYKMIKYDHNDGKGVDEMVVDCSFANGRCYRVTARRTNDLITPFDDGNFYFHEAVGNFTFAEIPSLGVEPAPDAHTIKANGTIELGWNRDRSRWGSYFKHR